MDSDGQSNPESQSNRVEASLYWLDLALMPFELLFAAVRAVGVAIWSVVAAMFEAS